ncbi:uncharacterized protein VTP21DRAFT_11400 [Calcarisporiella thermophila]|uniref:uncharacterized protein n=1 Tax=Calcarisporiella thermophila TaxID=911321 RepID=UPI003742FF38
MATDIYTLPDNLPVPVDDGACDHLTSMRLPPISLRNTNGELVDPSALNGLTVIYCYPMTSPPGIESPQGWDLIPGARGCTPQSCAFRDHAAELRQLGASHLFGLSTQSTEHQQELAERLHLPFPILSDEKFEFINALKLPTFEVDEVGKLVKRLTLIIQDGIIVKVFYPVFPPNRNAADVIAWLKTRHSSGK